MVSTSRVSQISGLPQTKCVARTFVSEQPTASTSRDEFLSKRDCLMDLLQLDVPEVC